MESKYHYGRGIERRARDWLLSQTVGLRLIAENYCWKGGELDLIFEEPCPGSAPELVFVEVRARNEGGWVDGLESVTYPKRLRIERTIRHFLSRYSGRAQSIRFDVLAWNGKAWSHYRHVRLLDA